jgi:hypothetical protein
MNLTDSGYSLSDLSLYSLLNPQVPSCILLTLAILAIYNEETATDIPLLLHLHFSYSTHKNV